MEGVEKVHVAKLWPFTEDVLDLPENYKLAQKKEIPVIEPYEEPAAPFLDHIPVEYMQNFIQKYQTETLPSGKKPPALVPKEKLNQGYIEYVNREPLIPKVGQHDANIE